MTVTRNTGADLLSLGQAPSYPGPRKQAIKAMRNAQARREREDAQRPYDADRLARNLADRPPDVHVNDGDDPAAPATREYLRKMGWTDARLDAARDELQRHVHPPNVTAGAGVSATRSRPSSHPNLERLGTAGLHIAAARAAGYDPVALWPSLRGLLGSAAPDRPAKPDQVGSKPRNHGGPRASPSGRFRSSGGSLDAQHDKATRQVQANRANPRSGKNEPSRAADRGRPVVRPRGERRS
jgi:hypothetical protein